jgi:hypothetical protein
MVGWAGDKGNENSQRRGELVQAVTSIILTRCMLEGWVAGRKSHILQKKLAWGKKDKKNHLVSTLIYNLLKNTSLFLVNI